MQKSEPKLDEDDHRAVPLATVASCFPAYLETVAPFVPKDEEITDTWWFDLWVKGGYQDYMNINAFTKEGMKKVLEMNGVDVDIDKLFHDKELHECFIEVAKIVYTQGNLHHIHKSLIEGMHRESAWTHAIFGAGFDPQGLIVPDTLTVGAYEEAGFELGDHGLTDKEFRRLARQRFFHPEKGQEDFGRINVRFYYVNKKGVEGSFLSEACVQVSKLHSDSKTGSNTICPWQSLGNVAETFISRIQYDNIVYRADFTDDRFRYPKHIKKIKMKSKAWYRIKSLMGWTWRQKAMMLLMMCMKPAACLRPKSSRGTSKIRITKLRG